MTAKQAHRAFWAASMAANAMPPGAERDAAMAEAQRLADDWRDAIAAEADARSRMMILPQGLFNPHLPTPRA